MNVSKNKENQQPLNSFHWIQTQLRFNNQFQILHFLNSFFLHFLGQVKSGEIRNSESDFGSENEFQEVFFMTKSIHRLSDLPP